MSFAKWNIWKNSGEYFSGTMRSSFHTLCNVFSFHRGDEKFAGLREFFLLVLRPLLSKETENAVTEDRIKILERLLESERSAEDISNSILELRRITPEMQVKYHSLLPEILPEYRRNVFEFLLSFAAAINAGVREKEYLHKLFAEFELTGDFETNYLKAKEAENRRRHIISSGLGLLAGIAVLLVFILTATWMSSLIFGLVFAYFLLPLEKHFERLQREKRGFGFHFFNFCGLMQRPWHSLSQKFMRRDAYAVNSEAGKEKRQKLIIHRAVAETLLCAVLFITAVSVISYHAGSFIFSHRKHNNNQIEAVNQRQIAKTAPNGATLSAPSNTGEKPTGIKQQVFDSFAEQHQKLLNKFPQLKEFSEDIRKMLHDENLKKEISNWLIKQAGGLTKLTLGLLGKIGALAGNILLIIFFTILFLTKMAEHNAADKPAKSSYSEDLVRSIFNGKWLPSANEETVKEAGRIVGGIFGRLKIWIRGYMTLILIDSTVYTIIFGILGISWYPVFGILSGCGIILPYIGPVIGFSVACAAALLQGGDANTLMTLVAAYLIYAGIIEQFILYPAVIGESLGLTALETIIVVLLGAVFAGIPGMLLAMPAGSILKYLVPQIYTCTINRHNTDNRKSKNIK